MRIFIIIFFVVFVCACVNEKKQEEKTPVDSVANNIAARKLETSNKTGYDTAYYENGAKKLGGMLLKGKREGLWTSWYADGTIWSEGEFRSGKPNGKTVTYFETGSKRYEGYYMEGKRAGKWFFWDEQGVLLNQKDYTK